MRVRIVSWERPGLILSGRRAGQFTLTYGEILTAERPIRGRRRGLLLHTRTSAKPVHLMFEGSQRFEIEERLRRRGVRIVDCWGAIVAPTLLDFEEELDREPSRVRQSSDDA